MKPLPDIKMDNSILRRTFIKRASLGSAALTSLLNESTIGSIKTKVAPKCKRVIVLCMAGGPSHLETFDFKPKLKELHGQPMPKSFTEGHGGYRDTNSTTRCPASVG